MNKKIKTGVYFAIFAVFLTVAFFAYQALTDNFSARQDPQPPSGAAVENAQEKIPAPDFALTDGEGNQVRLSDFKGKPIVLNFWASWCPPCKKEMPHFNKTYEKEKENVVFLMVNSTDGKRETVEKAKQYIASSGYDFPVYFDTNDQEASYAYGVSALPSTLFIDKDGNVIIGYQGGIDEETLLDGIKLIK